MNELRHKYSVIVYGDYELLDPEDEKVLFKRSLDGQSLLIVANFTSEELTRSYNEYGDMAGKLLLSNYSDDQKTKLRPYEAKVYYYGRKIVVEITDSFRNKTLFLVDCIIKQERTVPIR